VSDVVGEVIQERERQNIEWVEQNHMPTVWLAMLMEEVGEAAKAICEIKLRNYRRELIQVAAVAIAAVESLDRKAQKKRCDEEAE